MNHCSKWRWKPQDNGAYGIVYKATNLVNGKIYVGITVKCLERRTSVHYSSKNKTRFKSALTCYNKDLFFWKVIDAANNKKELLEKERLYIKALSPAYNMTLGGDGSFGRKASIEERQWRRQQMLERWKSGGMKSDWKPSEDQRNRLAERIRHRMATIGPHVNSVEAILKANRQNMVAIIDTKTDTLYASSKIASFYTNIKHATIAYQARQGVRNPRFVRAAA